MAGANNDAGKSIEVLKQVPDLAKILDSSSKKNSRKHRKEKDFMLGNAKQFSKSITYPDRGQRLLIEGEFGKSKVSTTVKYFYRNSVMGWAPKENTKLTRR